MSLTLEAGDSRTYGSVSNAVLFEFGDAFNGTLMNKGSMSVSATGGDLASSGADASAIGIDISGSLAGAIGNSGSLSVSATGGSSASYAAGATASGILMRSQMAGTIVNSGSLSVSVTGGTVGGVQEGASAWGIVLRSGLSGESGQPGQLLNTGTIAVTVNGSVSSVPVGDNAGYARVARIEIQGGLAERGLDGVVTNAAGAVISATGAGVVGTVNPGFAPVVGLRLQNLAEDSTIDNDGTISAAWTPATGMDTVSYGVVVNDTGTGALVIDNDGTISGGARGALVQTALTLNNGAAGQITAGSGTALEATGAAVITNAGQIAGMQLSDRRGRPAGA